MIEGYITKAESHSSAYGLNWPGQTFELSSFRSAPHHIPRRTTLAVGSDSTRMCSKWDSGSAGVCRGLCDPGDRRRGSMVLGRRRAARFQGSDQSDVGTGPEGATGNRGISRGLSLCSGARVSASFHIRPSPHPIGSFPPSTAALPPHGRGLQLMNAVGRVSA